MITEVHEERLLITSDTHFGGFNCKIGHELADFIEFASEENYSVCINGDVLDLMYTTIATMTRDTFDFLRHIKKTLRRPPRIYYIVGNHDIVMERYFSQWKAISVLPFLNVISGDKRVHIEHGHVYDQFFMRAPDMYNLATRVTGLCLRIFPGFFGIYKSWRELRYKHPALFGLRKNDDDRFEKLQESGENIPLIRAGREIAKRGFDSIIFGHTHIAGLLDLGSGVTLINTGSWYQKNPGYVRIDNGEIELLQWSKPNRK